MGFCFSCDKDNWVETTNEEDLIISKQSTPVEVGFIVLSEDKL